MALANSFQKGQIQVSCQLCEGVSKIQWKCCDCDVLICTKCRENIHSKFPNFNNHQVIDIKEVKNQDSRFRDVKCHQHTDQPCSLFCKTCKGLVCLKCIPKVHKGHDFVDEDEYRIKREKIRDKKTKIEMSLNHLKKMKEEIIKIKKPEYSKYDKSKKDILAQKVAVEKLVEELLNELDDKWKKVNQEWKGKQNELDKMEKKLHKQNTTVNELIKSKDVMQFFDLTDKLEGLLEDDVQINTKYSSMPKFVPGKVTKANIGTFLVDTPVKLESKTEFKVIKQFTSDLKCIHYTAVCADGSLWIGDDGSQLIQHVQIKGDKVKELLRLNTEVYSMAVTTGDVLLICGESKVKQVSRTGEMKDSPYSVAPLLPRAVNVTGNNTVIIGAMNLGPLFSATGRNVIIMDQMGNRLAEYELDNNYKQLFIFPRIITNTSEGYICVAEWLDAGSRGRVVVLSATGDVITTYSGHTDINQKIPFKPTDMITTALNNIVVVDMCTHTIHILDSEGHFITYYSTNDLGIIGPCSVALSITGNLFIGCTSLKRSPDTYKSILYEVEYFGF